MEPEMEATITPKELLKDLEREGKYVFHGSPSPLSELEPRQASNNNEPDGDPAVVATPYADIAIFRSLISRSREGSNEDNFSSSFDAPNGVPEFSATQAAIDNARKKDTVGFVYVFNSSDFEPFREGESRAYKNLKPLQVIEVHGSDLPDNIEIQS